MDAERLAKQIEFILEVDKLKHILRQTSLIDGSRQENDAEHSWHLALMATVFAEYTYEKELDLLRVIKMLLIHDLVEIDAGDTFAYDTGGTARKVEREAQAADRIFALLPDEQAVEMRSLWNEFEARTTLEARFAVAMDRLQPFLHNYYTNGALWQRHAVKRNQVISRNELIKDGAPYLWDYVSTLIEHAVEKQILAK